MRELRSHVTDIVSGCGGGCYVEHAFSNQPCVEVWDALGQYGFIGVNIPEEYGGGGAGMVELQIVCEEIQHPGHHHDGATRRRRVGTVGRKVLHLRRGRSRNRARCGEDRRGAGASLCLGIARHVLGKAVRYANERQVWDAPTGSHQGISPARSPKLTSRRSPPLS
ncbi:acyl-CoA dehydrogenase family protein [Arthrobacter sp. AZCC_0090]|uniref:acyl-CoA dehydrogenase family protein n=1 Tax=Arthrobacter sp. AZCC_0090 TaxID=2735881 RepID=UPI001C86B213|nr:acyl-CoA dehydrogenase family protein [Arthrobacter sp. AZCC_0090]